MARSKAGEIFVDLLLDTKQFQRETRGVQLKLHQLGRAFDSINNVMTQVVSGGLNSMAKGFGAFAKSTAKVGANFEQTMSQIGAVTNASSQEMRKMELQARKLGATTAFTATQAADAMLELSKAGLNASQVTQASGDILKLAGATGAQFSSTARSVVAAIKQFNLGFEQTGRVVDVFAQATSKSLLDMHSLTEAMKFGGIAGASFGMSIEETVSALAALRNIGLEGSLAGTNFRMAMAQAAVATDKERQMLKEYGLTLRDVSPEFNTFAEILETVANAGEAGMTGTEGMMVFGRRAGAQMVQLARQVKAGRKELREAEEAYTQSSDAENKKRLDRAKANLVDIDAFTKDLEQNSVGRAEDMYEKYLDNVSGQTTILLSKVQDVQLSVFDIVRHGLKDFIVELQKRVDTFSAVVDQQAASIDHAFRTVMDSLSDFLDDNSANMVDIFTRFLYTTAALIPHLGQIVSALIDAFTLIVKVFAVTRIVAFIAMVAKATEAVIILGRAIAVASATTQTGIRGVVLALGPIAAIVAGLTMAFEGFFKNVLGGFDEVNQAALTTSQILQGTTEEMIDSSKQNERQLRRQIDLLEERSEVNRASVAEAAFDGSSLGMLQAVVGAEGLPGMGVLASGAGPEWMRQQASALAGGSTVTDILKNRLDELNEDIRMGNAIIDGMQRAVSEGETISDIPEKRGHRELTKYSIAVRNFNKEVDVLRDTFLRMQEAGRGQTLMDDNSPYLHQLRHIHELTKDITDDEQQRLQILVALNGQSGSLSHQEMQRSKAVSELATNLGTQLMLEQRASEQAESNSRMQELASRQAAMQLESERQQRTRALRGMDEEEEKLDKLSAAKLRLAEATEKLTRSIRKRTAEQVRSLMAAVEDNDVVDEAINDGARLVASLYDLQEKEIKDFEATQKKKIKILKIEDSKREELFRDLESKLTQLREEQAEERSKTTTAVEEKTTAELKQIYEDQLRSIERSYISQVDSREAALIQINRLEEEFLLNVALARIAASEAGISMTEEMEAYIEAVKEAIAFQKVLAGMSDAERQRFEFFSNLIDDRAKSFGIFVANIAPLMDSMLKGKPFEDFADKLSETTAESIKKGMEEGLGEGGGLFQSFKNMLDQFLQKDLVSKGFAKLLMGDEDVEANAAFFGGTSYMRDQAPHWADSGSESATLQHAIERGYQSILRHLENGDETQQALARRQLNLLADWIPNHDRYLSYAQSHMEDTEKFLFKGIGPWLIKFADRSGSQTARGLWDKFKEDLDYDANMKQGGGRSRFPSRLRAGQPWDETLAAEAIRNLGQVVEKLGAVLEEGGGLGEALEPGGVWTVIGQKLLRLSSEPGDALDKLSGRFFNMAETSRNLNSGMFALLSKLGPAAIALAALVTVAFKAGKALLDLVKKFVNVAIGTIDRLTSIVFGSSLKGLIDIAAAGITGEEGEEQTPMEVLSGKMEEFFDRIANIERFLPAVATTVAQGLIRAVPALFGAIANLVPTLIGIMAQNAGPLFKAIGEGIASVLSNLPQFAEFLLDAFRDIASAAPDIISRVLSSGMSFFAKLPSIIEEALEIAFTAFMDLAKRVTGKQMTAFLGGLASVSAKITAMLAKAFGFALEVLLEMLPELVQALVVLLGGRGFQAILIEAAVIIIEATFRVFVAIVKAIFLSIFQDWRDALKSIFFIWIESINAVADRLVDGLISVINLIPGVDIGGDKEQVQQNMSSAEDQAAVSRFDKVNNAIVAGFTALGALVGFTRTFGFGTAAGAGGGAAIGGAIKRFRENRRYGDTPGVLRADGGAFSFAPGDYFAAARTPGALLKQAVDAFSSSGGMSRISSPAMDFGFNQMAGSLMNIGSSGGGAMQPSFTSVTVKAEGQVLDSILVRAQRKGHAPEMSRLLRKNSSVRIGLDRGKFAPQSG